jgi:hypothetical protein
MEPTIMIHIKALNVSDNGNGTFSIELPERPLSNDEQQLLERLFPNLGEEVFRLLNKESLLASLATPAEVQMGVRRKNALDSLKK